MGNPALSKWWKIILNKDINDLQDPRLPLIGLAKYLIIFELPPSPPIEFQGRLGLENQLPDASFENLTEEILVCLRGWIFTRMEFDPLALWAEKLMRFCEIRYPVLEQRANKKWGDKKIARLNMLHLAAFLLDYGIYANDIRFVNTVLKLGDLKWLLNRKKIKGDLSHQGDKLLPALFEFRIILMTEYALNRIGTGKAL